MSARALPFLVLPLVIMLVAILLEGNAPGPITANNTAEFCSQPGQTNCVQPGSTTTYFCGLAVECQLKNDATGQILQCNAPPYPNPAYCLPGPPDPFGAGEAVAKGCFLSWVTGNVAACGIFIPPFSSVTLGGTQLATSLSANAAFFTFGMSGSSGFITMIGVVVGLISLLSLTLFGSGMQGEGLHTLFMGGMVLGLWLMISGVEGFIGGTANPQEMFGALNHAIAGAGSFLFMGLTLSVVIGFTGLVSRGS